MLSEGEEENLIGEVLRASLEAVTLEDLGNQFYPQLHAIFNAQASVLYRCNAKGRPVLIAATPLEVFYEYGNLAGCDALSAEMQRLNLFAFYPDHCSETDLHYAQPTARPSSRPYPIDKIIHLRICGNEHQEPGRIGLVLGRTWKQAQFSERDHSILERILPFLEALARRSETLSHRLRAQPVVEAMVEKGECAKLALTMAGEVLWVSGSAENLLGIDDRGRPKIPEILANAIQRIGNPCGKKPEETTSFPPLILTGMDGFPIRVSFSFAATHSGVLFIIVSLEALDPERTPLGMTQRFHLTPAERNVLAQLARGLSDQEIARRLYISLPTVRTHVSRILDKLGVHSRVQAALIAHGHEAEGSPSAVF